MKDNTRDDAVLDQIFSSEPGMILRTEMKTVQKCTYNYSNADVIRMESYMMRIKWNKELQNKNIEGMWCIFSSILNKCRNKYVPKTTGRKKRKKNNVDGQCK